MSWFHRFHRRHSVRSHVLFRLLDTLGDILMKLQDLQNQQTITNQKLDELANRVAQIPGAEDLQPAIDAEVAIQNKIDAIAPAAPTV